MYSVLITNMQHMFLYVLYLCALGNYAFAFFANFMAKIFYLADY